VLAAAIEEQYARIDVLAGRTVGLARNELSSPANLPDTPGIDLAATPADLLRRRPDIIAADARLAARDAGVAAALRDRLPRFNLAGLIGTIAGAIHPLFSAAAFTAQGTAGLSYSISMAAARAQQLTLRAPTSRPHRAAISVLFWAPSQMSRQRAPHGSAPTQEPVFCARRSNGSKLQATQFASASPKVPFL